MWSGPVAELTSNLSRIRLILRDRIAMKSQKASPSQGMDSGTKPPTSRESVLFAEKASTKRSALALDVLTHSLPDFNGGMDDF